MLDECAPGHARKLQKHNYAIFYQGKTYPALPKGAHGKANPLIEKGHVKRMVRFFGILECAKKVLQIS